MGAGKPKIYRADCQTGTQMGVDVVVLRLKSVGLQPGNLQNFCVTVLM